jgi:hypothetical protein
MEVEMDNRSIEELAEMLSKLIPVSAIKHTALAEAFIAEVKCG